MIICHLKRSKLDANHTLLQGAEGNEEAEQAWNEYHGFIEAATTTIEKTWKRGFYLDVHGHTHEIQRIELGYIVDGAEFRMSDTNLNDWELRDTSSIRRLAKEAAARFVDLLRGNHSLGTLLEDAGFPTVPSTNQPDPGLDPYTSGDWCIKWYGSDEFGPVDAIQLTLNWDGVRDTVSNRNAFAQALAEKLEFFIETHYVFDLQAGPPQ